MFHMKIKNAVFVLLFIVLTINTFAQVKVEVQLAGTGTLGFSLNTVLDIKLSQNGNNVLSPSFGMGMIFPFEEKNYWSSMNVGLNYNYLKYGIGFYLIGFTPMPFFDRGSNESLDVIVAYPNVNYTVINKQQWYFKIQQVHICHFQG